MPDFERLIDKLSLDLAETPEQLARAEGFIAGKNYARKELLKVIIMISLIVSLIWLWLNY